MRQTQGSLRQTDTRQSETDRQTPVSLRQTDTKQSETDRQTDTKQSETDTVTKYYMGKIGFKCFFYLFIIMYDSCYYPSSTSITIISYCLSQIKSVQWPWSCWAIQQFIEGEEVSSKLWPPYVWNSILWKNFVHSEVLSDLFGVSKDFSR